MQCVTQNCVPRPKKEEMKWENWQDLNKIYRLGHCMGFNFLLSMTTLWLYKILKGICEAMYTGIHAMSYCGLK